MRILKADFIDSSWIQNRRFGQLHVLKSRDEIISALRQIEPANSLIVRARSVVVVPSNQRVVCVDGVIKTGTEVCVAARNQKALAHLNGVEIGIEHSRAYQLIVIGFYPIELNKVRRLSFYKRTVQVEVVLAKLEWSSLAGTNRERITRVQALVIEVKRCPAA